MEMNENAALAPGDKVKLLGRHRYAGFSGVIVAAETLNDQKIFRVKVNYCGASKPTRAFPDQLKKI